MSLRTVSLAALCWCCAFNVWAASDTEAKAWLERMAEAAGRLSYEGTLIYVQGAHVESLRILQSADVGRQRMQALNGAQREVVIANDKAVCLLPNRRLKLSGSGHLRPVLPAQWGQDLAHLEQHYEFKLGGADRVADHAVQVVDIQPRDTLRYGYRLWLERDSALVLRSALLDQQQHPLEQMLFTQLQMNPQFDAQALQSAELSSLPTAPTLTEVQDSRWQVSLLPEGFTQQRHTRYQRTEQPEGTEHIVVSDGLASVSIFIERLAEGQKPILQGASPLGAMNAYGQLRDGYQTLVVGDVPPQTVKLIADHLQASPAP